MAQKKKQKKKAASPPSLPDLVTITQAAEYLGVNRQAVFDAFMVMRDSIARVLDICQELFLGGLPVRPLDSLYCSRDERGMRYMFPNFWAVMRITLKDADGKVRLSISIDTDGNPNIQLFDRQGVSRSLNLDVSSGKLVHKVDQSTKLTSQVRSFQLVNEADTQKPNNTKPNISSDSGFDRFFQSYPRHEAKKAAVKAWRGARFKPEEETKVLTALERHKRAWELNGTEKRHIPLPGTWLNGRRWEDEIDAPAEKIRAGRCPAYERSDPTAEPRGRERRPRGGALRQRSAL